MPRLRSPVAIAGLGVALVLAVAAVATGRGDVAVIGVTLLVAVVVAAAKGRGDSNTSISLTVLPQRDANSLATVRVEVDPDPVTETVLLRLAVLGARRRRVAVAGHTVIEVRVPVEHSGRIELLRATSRDTSADVLTVTVPAAPVSAHTVVAPRAHDVPFLPLPARLRGLTGNHESSRPGDGGEFRDIHPFAAGDRLRRIDWKATARLARQPGDLYVRRTNATSDAHVVIVLDDGDDVGEYVETWQSDDPMVPGITSLDVARDAAWSLAAAYLASADPVSFQVLSRARGTVPPGAGVRQRERLRAAIARVGAQPRGFTRSRTPLVASGALVVLLSTFLDDDAVRLAELWRAAGHRVLAVDILPRLQWDRLNRQQKVALRVVLARREDRLQALRTAGGDLVRWDASVAERTATLRQLTRTRRSS